jgi:hypothetical protein
MNGYGQFGLVGCTQSQRVAAAISMSIAKCVSEVGGLFILFFPSLNVDSYLFF